MKTIKKIFNLVETGIVIASAVIISYIIYHVFTGDQEFSYSIISIFLVCGAIVYVATVRRLYNVRKTLKVFDTSYNKLPEYSSATASGIDLRAYVEIKKSDNLVHYSLTIEPKKTKTINTGIYIEIPEGYEGQIRPRSGLAAKHGITVLNTPGTIDSDYRGEVLIILHNTSDKPFVVNNEDRIAQLVITPVTKVNIKEVSSYDCLSKTKRGKGGIGSTGVK